MIMMGEEAPLHPEIVIPTNPAYRDRARTLLAGAAKAIGFASGGMYSKGMLAQLWYNQGGDPKQGNVAASVALAESGGDPRSVGIPTSAGRALGLWQIMWPLHQPSYPDRDPFDPNDNAYMATRISSNGSNWQPWEAYTNGAYRQFLDDPMGGIDPAGRALSAVGRFAAELASKGIGWALDKVKGMMPDLGRLPGWLAGVGSFLERQIAGLGKGEADRLPWLKRRWRQQRDPERQDLAAPDDVLVRP